MQPRAESNRGKNVTRKQREMRQRSKETQERYGKEEETDAMNIFQITASEVITKQKEAINIKKGSELLSQIFNPFIHWISDTL